MLEKNIHEAKLMNAKSYEPLQVSNTKFVAHEHPVLCNQYHNWPIQYSHWEHHAQEIWRESELEHDDKQQCLKSEEVTEAQNRAAELRNVTNITVFLSMIKITDLLTCSSCRLQSTKKFPWEFPDIIKDLLIKLNYTKEWFQSDIKHPSYSESDHKEDKLKGGQYRRESPPMAVNTYVEKQQKRHFFG